MESLLAIFTLFLFVLWKVYWWISEKRADREKPRIRKRPSLFNKVRILEYGVWFVLLVLFAQLILHISILSINDSFYISSLGFLFVLLGLGLCIVSRKELAGNWANSWEYQIKEKQNLVTTGVYGFIRHPIYAGLGIAFIGAELEAKSWLVVIFLSYFFVAYRQAKKEEVLLEKHFGNSYRTYMKHTKMFLPYLW